MLPRSAACAITPANALQRLTSLDESNDDEAAAVHHVLSIFENMIEVKPEVAEMVVENTKVAALPRSRYTA